MTPADSSPQLSPAQRSLLLELARTLLPEGSRLPGASPASVARAEDFVREISGGALRGLGLLTRLLDGAALLRTGHRFQRLSPARQTALVERWQRDPVLRWPLAALSFLFKMTHFDDPEVYQRLGCQYLKGGPATPARWLSRVRRGAELGASEQLECDVVVIGTGAGGAVVGKELAEQGLAVLFVEEGEHHRRDAFRGSAVEAHRKFYRDKAGVVSLGNTVMPVLMGRLVGGSTAINTGTCFRTPDRVLERWCETLGSDALAPAQMQRHFERVEQTLEVAPAPERLLGGAARVVARGCERLGWHHFALRRNAPACDAQGVCDFGCPSEARRSMDVSYLPAALGRGALMVTGLRATLILIEGGRAVGVEARAQDGKLVEVRARAVVLAGGAVPTPALLLEQGLCNRSGQVGRNLSLHPGTAVSARFDERLGSYNAIQQGQGCDQFQHQGILLLGANAPISIAANMFALTGRALMDVMDAYDQIASFGVMIQDETRGRVRLLGGRPTISYWLQPTDVARLHAGMVRIAEIFHAAGAREIYPLLARLPRLSGRQGIDALRALRVGAGDLRLTSFHPLGTCRMGRDPARSVVDLDHQAHELPGLFIVDGSTVPGPPGVNPQLTIMAMATRAAEGIGRLMA